MKSHGPEVLLTKGDRISAYPDNDVASGNPYRNGNQFGNQPGGKKGKVSKVDCVDALGLLGQIGEVTDSDICQDPSVPDPPQPPPEVELQPERAPMPPNLAAEGMLMWQEDPKEPKSSQDMADDFQSGSQHLQGQEADYLQALRNWQARYGG